jgi:hypothetical protein
MPAAVLNQMLRGCAATAGCLACLSAFAQGVSVKEPWVRATVAGQSVAAAFMILESARDARLVAASSPAAERVEIHATILEGGVAKMRPLPRVDLPAGRPVKLAPGGIHVMLLGLKTPLVAGTTVPLTLHVEGRERARVDVMAEVRPIGAGGDEPAHRH